MRRSQSEALLVDAAKNRHTGDVNVANRAAEKAQRLP